MRGLLLLAMILPILTPVQSANGVIWNKRGQDFVPIFNIPVFAAINQEVINQSRAEETHNFQGRLVRLSYYELTNLVSNEANGLKVTGAIGEVWNTLSELLNFTLKPIITYETSVGYMNPNGTYTIGLLGMLYRNETDVVPRVEIYNKRLAAAVFTVPLWSTNNRMYIRQEIRHHNPTWIVKLFSRKVWVAILTTYSLLSICSYLTQKMTTKIKHEKWKASLKEHLFYNFAMFCDQSHRPNHITKSSRTVELWLGVFCRLVKTTFDALLIGYMAQIIIVPPFDDMKSLLEDTSYDILTVKGSFQQMYFQVADDPIVKKLVAANRVKNIETQEEMYKIICTANKLYVMMQAEDLKKTVGMYVCRLNPVGRTLRTQWISSAISKKFTYKRTIDVGIIKMFEFGLMQRLKHRWIEIKNVEYTSSKKVEPIMLEQIYLILLMFSSGVFISFTILVTEILIFYYTN
ncbi:uncharacterized protein LOC128879883 [Hylaeus volcanicus]|uniref:uncharacterized protein LOC128879883 n=1 Tax=Hylaeus volcanicus TaxID=313075 RepID=UPI0023B799C6|nr:uncharacterized protein LOC128879883 [Hylaeus volcanicus]